MEPTRYKIERGIELPQLRDLQRVYPYMDMTVGDSFLVPCSADKAPLILKRMQNSAHRFGKRHQVKFVARRVDKGVRCWRVK